ncbi:MAG: hypothetical protein E3J52_02315 [Promethearchaeota archaeon]|nr:MAG: hypothetical protein E3J52_02315 [Candidatus Lokiarchaeota archaeon]
MEDTEYLPLNQLFDSIGIIEKGIERIYHHLLLNKRIDNLKEVCDQFNLSLKRGYKICSVLSDLELVQIYDRPMKIHIATPIMILWQDLIQNRIEDLSSQFNEKREKCESAIEDFTRNYKLDQQVVQEPVEFINYSVSNFDESYHQFLAQSECKIAIGIRYDNPLISMIHEDRFQNIPDDMRTSMRAGMSRIKENLRSINVQVIFNSEVAKDLLSSNEFKLLTNHVEPYNLEFKKLEIHVTDEAFSNFSLTDNELIQPSFDPTNILIGAYISRNKNIYQIFYDKFNEIFEKGIPMNRFITEQKDIGIDSLSETQLFVLCVM